MTEQFRRTDTPEEASKQEVIKETPFTLDIKRGERRIFDFPYQGASYELEVERLTPNEKGAFPYIDGYVLTVKAQPQGGEFIQLKVLFQQQNDGSFITWPMISRHSGKEKSQEHTDAHLPKGVGIALCKAFIDSLQDLTNKLKHPLRDQVNYDGTMPVDAWKRIFIPMLEASGYTMANVDERYASYYKDYYPE